MNFIFSFFIIQRRCCYLFRDCYFTYNGIYSGDYNLILAFITDDNFEFKSGSEYEPTTATLPHNAQQLLYNLNYSDSPLEFTIEIISPEDNIPLETMIEIKNWLFGQDGWKRLTLHNETSDYYLNALFIPDSDITDARGYRGLRCKIQNDSGFWYQDNEVEFTGVTSKPSNTGQTLSFETTIDIEGQPINNKICPIIDLKIGHNWTEHQIDYTLSNYRVYVGNKLNKSMFVFDANVNYHTDKDAVYELDTKYGMVTMKEPNERTFHSLTPPFIQYNGVIKDNLDYVSLFWLGNGQNQIYLYIKSADKTDAKHNYAYGVFDPDKSLVLKYTTMHRLGGI